MGLRALTTFRGGAGEDALELFIAIGIGTRAVLWRDDSSKSAAIEESLSKLF